MIGFIKAIFLIAIIVCLFKVVVAILDDIMRLL